MSTESGLRTIESIEKGDLVWSRDESSGETKLKRVVQTFEKHAATLKLVFSNGASIETTREHPFYVEHKGFTPAGELGIGTSIVTLAEPTVRLVSAAPGAAQPVFNFEVEDFHAYFVEQWVATGRIMPLTPPVHLTARSRVPASAWETALRLGCATLATLLAIGGAQLVIPNRFIAPVLVATLLGVPVSAYLRYSGMRVGRYQLSRGLWNSFTVLVTFLVSAFSLYRPVELLVSQFIDGMTTGQFLTHFGPDTAVTLLMQVFLIFAACRSFAQISDKDATLSTVPSFSILLLLSPLQRNIEVVFYFLAWMTVAAVLFALDHRSNLRERVTAHVPPLLPGQDARLAARSLASILALSLGSAAAISVFLASRDAADRSKTEEAIADLASRLTRYALSIPEISSVGGPERRIDFSSPVSPPTQAEIWQVSARLPGGKPLFVPYWRMFTLNFYDGRSWGQSLDPPIRIKREPLRAEVFPPRPVFMTRDELRFWRAARGLERYRNGGNRNRDDGNRNRRDSARRETPLTFSARVSPLDSSLFFPPNADAANPLNDNSADLGGFASRNVAPEGFDVQHAAPNAAFQFGPQSLMVKQDIISLMPTLGFLPVLPSARGLQIDSNVRDISTRGDGALSLGALPSRVGVHLVSDVPELPEYGFGRTRGSMSRLSAAQIEASKARLTPRQRGSALQLPPNLPRRVRDLGRSILGSAARSENNLRLAQRLALAIQLGATYTLNPPSLSEGRDAADFFLFEGAKRGYCTHFAGALTVLCRSQGIPARVVSGFINTDESRSAQSVLREANAHAWTEVWIEGWGWAVVDATPADDRGHNALNWLGNWQNWGLNRVEALQNWAAPRFNSLMTAAIGLLMFLMWRRRIVPRLWQRLHRKPGQDERERRLVIETYGQVARQMTRKFRPRATSETPDEWLQTITERLSAPDSEALRRITALYTAALYAPQPLPNGSGALAARTASTLAWKLVK